MAIYNYKSKVAFMQVSASFHKHYTFNAKSRDAATKATDCPKCKFGTIVPPKKVPGKWVLVHKWHCIDCRAEFTPEEMKYNQQKTL